MFLYMEMLEIQMYPREVLKKSGAFLIESK